MQTKKEEREEAYQKLLSKNREVLTEHFDPDFRDSLIRNVISLIDRAYFRCRFIGFDEPIERNHPGHPVILASNHSGMAFPWDAMMFSAMMVEREQFDRKNALKVLTAPILSMTTLMNPFLIPRAWYKAGGIDATYLNFETLMHHAPGNILIYPEGVPGIGKGFNNRYKLRRLASSFIRMSVKYRTDIVPFATVNAEYINPYSYSWAPLNKLTRKIGIPFLPITVLLIFLIFQPWLFYFAFPANITFVRGKRLKPYEWTNKPYDELTARDFSQLQQRMQKAMQQQLDEAVAQYGQQPYRWMDFFRAQWKLIRHFPYHTVFGWPFLFEEFKRLIRKHPDGKFNMKTGWGSLIPMLVRNPVILAYYIPVLGWLIILYLGYRDQKLTRANKANTQSRPYV